MVVMHFNNTVCIYSWDIFVQRQNADGNHALIYICLAYYCRDVPSNSSWFFYMFQKAPYCFYPNSFNTYKLTRKEEFPERLMSAYHLYREKKARLYGNHSENITVYLQFRQNHVLRIKVVKQFFSGWFFEYQSIVIDFFKQVDFLLDVCLAQNTERWTRVFTTIFWRLMALVISSSDIIQNIYLFIMLYKYWFRYSTVLKIVMKFHWVSMRKTKAMNQCMM